jgi:hypothetical protein
MLLQLIRKHVYMALLMVFAAGLEAQEANPRVSLFGSASILSGERNFIINGEPFRSEFINGGKLGLRGTIDLTERWSLEGAYRFGNNNLHITEEVGGNNPENRTFGIRQHQITASGLFFLNRRQERLRWFVSRGTGLLRFSPTDEAKIEATDEFVDNPAPNIRAENKWSFHFGLGLEAMLSRRWGLRVDLQDHVASIPRFGLPRSPSNGADFFPVSGVVHTLEPSIGFVYSFGQ